MDLLETIGVMPGDLGDFLGTSGYETWTGFDLVSDSLELYLQNDKHIYLFKSIYAICCFYHI